MRNAALCAQFTKYEQDRENTCVSDRQRKIAYAVMGILIVFIIAVIALFWII